MDYEDKLQLILKTVSNHDYIVISHDELREAIKDQITGDTHNLTDDLIKLGYIIPNSTTKKGAYILGFSPQEKGKYFLKNGGFKKQRIEKTIKRIGSVIIFVVTVWTFVITLKGCYKEADKSKPSSQTDSLYLNKAESYPKSASSTVN